MMVVLERFSLPPSAQVIYLLASSLPSLREALGAVAQLGERRNGIAEVRGSTPLGSTKLLILSHSSVST